MIKFLNRFSFYVFCSLFEEIEVTFAVTFPFQFNVFSLNIREFLVV